MGSVSSSPVTSLPPTLNVEVTAALNRLAVLQSIQCSGIEAGGSDIRTPTGVRSPTYDIQ